MTRGKDLGRNSREPDTLFRTGNAMEVMKQSSGSAITLRRNDYEFRAAVARLSDRRTEANPISSIVINPASEYNNVPRADPRTTTVIATQVPTCFVNLMTRNGRCNQLPPSAPQAN